MKANQNLSASDSSVYNLIYAQDPDGRDLTVKTTPVAVVEISPSDDSLTREKLYQSVIKKYLAKGDMSRFAEYERMLDDESAEIRDWIEAGGTFLFDNLFFSIKQIEAKEDMVDEDGFLLVSYDAEEGTFNLAEDSVTSYNIQFVPVVNAASIPSPFMGPSPFVVKNGKHYLVDKEGNAKGEPYTGICGPAPYVVGREKGVGVVSASGEEILPCIYEEASHEVGGAISFSLEGLTGFYLPHLGLICPPKYKEIDFSDGEEVIRVLTDEGWGFLDKDLKFYSVESWENGECDNIAFI